MKKKMDISTYFNQWKNTNSVLKWFIDIPNKNDSSFIQLVPNQDTLTNAIQFALHTPTDEKDLRLIILCRKSLLCCGNETCKTKSTESWFEITMDSFDGAKICELVGLFIQSNLEDILPKTNLIIIGWGINSFKKTYWLANGRIEKIYY